MTRCLPSAIPFLKPRPLPPPVRFDTFLETFFEVFLVVFLRVVFLAIRWRGASPAPLKNAPCSLGGRVT